MSRWTWLPSRATLTKSPWWSRPHFTHRRGQIPGTPPALRLHTPDFLLISNLCTTSRRREARWFWSCVSHSEFTVLGSAGAWPHVVHLQRAWQRGTAKTVTSTTSGKPTHRIGTLLVTWDIYQHDKVKLSLASPIPANKQVSLPMKTVKQCERSSVKMPPSKMACRFQAAPESSWNKTLTSRTIQQILNIWHPQFPAREHP